MKALARGFDRTVAILSALGAAVAVASLVAMSFATMYEVVARYFFNAPSVWTEELSAYWLVAITFLGAGFSLRKGSQLEVDALTARLSSRARRSLGLATDAISTVFCFIAVISSAIFVYQSYRFGHVSISELEVRTYIPLLALPIGFAIFGLEFMVRILRGLGLLPPANLDSSASRDTSASGVE